MDVLGQPPTQDAINKAANANRVQRLLPEDKFRDLFSLANYGNGPDPEHGPFHYLNFLRAVTLWPSFCDDAGPSGDEARKDDMCKTELATMFAHWVQETGANWPDHPSGRPKWQQALYNSKELCSLTNSCEPYVNVDATNGVKWPPVPGVKYFGRGAHQVSWNYNYGGMSDLLFNDVSVLLKDPDMVISSEHGWLAFSSAVWYHMTPQSPKPSGHDVVTGWWTPNQADTQAGRLPGFGAQIMIINGAIECGSLFGTSALNRIESYKALTNYLGVSAGSNLECGNMSPFDSSSNGVHDQYWTPKPWFTPCKCQLDWVPDGYSIYNSPSNAYCQCMAACHY